MPTRERPVCSVASPTFGRSLRIDSQIRREISRSRNGLLADAREGIQKSYTPNHFLAAPGPIWIPLETGPLSTGPRVIHGRVRCDTSWVVWNVHIRLRKLDRCTIKGRHASRLVTHRSTEERRFCRKSWNIHFIYLSFYGLRIRLSRLTDAVRHAGYVTSLYQTALLAGGTTFAAAGLSSKNAIVNSRRWSRVHGSVKGSGQLVTDIPVQAKVVRRTTRLTTAALSLGTAVPATVPSSRTTAVARILVFAETHAGFPVVTAT